VFGPRAPKIYHETLNPKYVPPSNPPSRESEGVKAQNNMCVSRKVVEGSGSQHSIEREERERDASHTHIVNSVIEPTTKYLEPNTKNENGYKTVHKHNINRKTQDTDFGLTEACPYLKVGNGGAVVCTACFWNGGPEGKPAHRPLSRAEVLLCKDLFAECPDYRNKARGR